MLCAELDSLLVLAARRRRAHRQFGTSPAANRIQRTDREPVRFPFVAGHKRFGAGTWRLTVEGPPYPITGRRQQLHRTVRAPNTMAGATLQTSS
jgi:hypothetical protein